MRRGAIGSDLRQRGIALVLVLWILVLLTVTTGAFALMARMDQLEANQLLSGTQARLWAEAGLHLAVVALREPEEEYRLVADGRIYEQVIDGVRIEMSAIDERGKVDLNAADTRTLAVLFANHGLDEASAQLLANRVADWRDPDDVERADGAEIDSYLAAGLPVGPANRDFLLTEELLQVQGMSYALFRSLERGVTVYSRTAMPSVAFAPAEALMAIPEITPEEARNFVEMRQSQDPESLLSLDVPGGPALMAQGRGLTYSVRVKATMPNGVWDQIEATIRLGGGVSGAPFRTVRWKEAFHN